MKTEFQLETTTSNPDLIEKTGDLIRIIGTAPDNAVYVVIECKGRNGMFIPDDDLELFAVNILKALKSKHLK